jgi:hypothetical protein
MSDGYSWGIIGSSPAEEPGGFSAQETVFVSAAAPRRRVFGASPEDLAEWLPRLGSVLWLSHRARDSALPARRDMRLPGGVAHPALACLSQYRALRAHSTITPQGPREWLSFHAATGAPEARLFLLPDSDLLAWDRMNDALRLGPVPQVEHEPPVHSTFLRRALSRSTRAWQARLLEFRTRPSARRGTLDAQSPLRISLLGLDIAQRIVRDENAEWMFPLFSM